MADIKGDIQIILEDLQRLNLTTEITNLIDKVKGVITKVETENPQETADIEKVVEDAPITPVIEADVVKIEEAVTSPETIGTQAGPVGSVTPDTTKEIIGGTA